MRSNITLPLHTMFYVVTINNGCQLRSGKARLTLAERGLDFERCHEVFGGIHMTVEDTRESYGETRNITLARSMRA
jgi:uncharacterized DUF497 family protein